MRARRAGAREPESRGFGDRGAGGGVCQEKRSALCEPALGGDEALRSIAAALSLAGFSVRVCVVIGDGRGTATLMFVPDPEKKRRALAHGRGYALSHVERTLPPSLREDVIGLGRAFSREAGQDGSLVGFVQDYLARNRSRALLLRSLKLP